MNRPGKILLVEDNAREADLILSALAKINLANEVVVARNGGEALDYLRRQGEFKARSPGNPVVVFLNLKMPKVDGLEVLRQMKGDAELKIIPIVVLTSSREEADLARSYELGANSYVVKPVDPLQFVDSMRQLGMFWAMVNEPPQRRAKP